MALPAPQVTSQLESDPPAPPAQHSTCLNCGAQLTDAFCAHCGQRASDVHLSVRDLLHELVTEHFGLDTKTGRTLVALVRYPGRLTLEFLAGRRIRYLPPLRLYLSLSVLYFLASALTTNAGFNTNANVVHITTSPAATNKSGGMVSLDTTAANPVPIGAALDSIGISSHGTTDVIGDTLHGNAVIRFVKRRFAERLAFFRAHKSDAVQQISERFHHELPDALFLLVPGLALALLVLYRKHYYSEHLVFALHFQAFAFVALTIGLIPYLDALANIAIIVYLFLALRHVYGQSIAATAAKFVVVVIGYGISLALVMARRGRDRIPFRLTREPRQNLRESARIFGIESPDFRRIDIEYCYQLAVRADDR